MLDRPGRMCTRSVSFLVQIFLPLQDNRGKPIAERHFKGLAEELSERFGGLTAYIRAPATGLWKKQQNARMLRDEIVIYEVIIGRLDRRWWRQKRQALQQTFRQQEILIRAHGILLL
jgi:hypothetical protein